MTAVEVLSKEDIHLPFVMDYLNPALHGPSYVEVTIEVNAPAGTDIATRIDLRCPSSGGSSTSLNYPADFTNGVATATIHPSRSVSDCLITEYHNVNGSLPPAWDHRVDGECGNRKTVTIYGESTSHITFSRTWVEPYVAQCNGDS